MLAFWQVTAYNDIMIVNFNFEAFKVPLRSLKPLINANISFYDESFKDTYACTEPSNPLCSAVKENLSSRCMTCDRYVMENFDRLAKEDGNGFHYDCHFGLKEIIYRMEHQGESYGYILVGPFRTPDRSEDVMQYISDYCAQYGLDRKLLLDAYFQIPEFTQEKYDAIKTVITTLFEYAIAHNMIRLRSNSFALEITNYIKENIGSPLTTQSLAKQFSITEKRLCTLVQKATGQLPKHYITAVRIAQASKLLETTELSIRDIAVRIGIPDYNYFSKVFRQSTGESPSSYRKLHRVK